MNLNTTLRVAALLCTAWLFPALAAPPGEVESAPTSAPVAAAPSSAPLLAETAAPPADLVFHNRPIATLRAVALGVTPEDRVSRIGPRIQELLERSRKDEVGVLTVEGARVITLNTWSVFTLLPGDLDPAAAEDLDQAAAKTAERLKAAITAYREDQKPMAKVRVIAAVVISTALLLIALRVVFVLKRILRRRLEDATLRRLAGVSRVGLHMMPAERIARIERFVLDALVVTIALLLTYYWLVFNLAQFTYTERLGQTLGGFLLGRFGVLLRGAVAAIPGILTVAVILLLARGVTRLLRSFFEAVKTGAVEIPWLHPETAEPTLRIAIVIVWIFALVVAYPFLPGSESLAFKGVSVFVGLMISLGSSGLVNQMMSGLVLMYARALKPGDYVLVGEYEGTVTTLGMLSTKIRTPKLEEVTIPNAVVVGSATRNYSKLAGAEGVILHTSVTIGYDAPWRQVHAMLIRAAERSPGLRREPPPFVLQRALGDFYVEYQLNAHLERPELRPMALSALHANIQDQFNEHGVQIMSPHYVADPAQRVVVPKDRWYEPPAQRDDGAAR